MPTTQQVECKGQFSACSIHFEDKGEESIWALEKPLIEDDSWARKVKSQYDTKRRIERVLNWHGRITNSPDVKIADNFLPWSTPSALCLSSLQEEWLAWGMAQGYLQAVKQALRSGRTQEQIARVKEFKDYISECERLCSISPDVATLVWRSWEKLDAAAAELLEVPDACPGFDGELLLTWDRNSDHFEMEVEADLQVTLFYVNSEKNLSWESHLTADETIDRRTGQVLQLFQIPNLSAPPSASAASLRNYL